MRALLPLLTLLPSAALAQAVQPPPLPPYSSEDELWFAIASAAMILSLGAVHWLVKRR